MIEQELDELEMIQVRFRHRIVAAFDVAIVGREIQGRPAALVGDVGVGAALNQELAQPVVPVVRRGQQRRPAVFGRLVHVGAGVEQDPCRLEIAFAGGKDQRCQPAAAGTNQAGDDHVGVVRVRRRRRCGSRLRRGRGLRRTGLRLPGAGLVGGGLTTGGRRHGVLGRPRAAGAEHAAEPERDLHALRRFVFELLLVGPAGRGGGGVAPLRVADRRGVDARRHVIAGETGRTAVCGDVGAELDERLDRRRVALLRRPHQRRRAAQLLFRIHVGAGGDEQLDGVGPAIARRVHHQRLAVRSKLFRAGAGLQQSIDDRRAAVLRRHRDRRDAFAVRRIGPGTGAQQQIHGLDLVAVDRPVQRRCAVNLRRVDIDVLLQERAQRRRVAFHHRIGHIAAAGRGCAGGDRPEDDDRPDDSTCSHAIHLSSATPWSA